jgi:hypothetical protein
MAKDAVESYRSHVYNPSRFYKHFFPRLAVRFRILQEDTDTFVSGSVAFALFCRERHP